MPTYEQFRWFALVFTPRSPPQRGAFACVVVVAALRREAGCRVVPIHRDVSRHRFLELLVSGRLAPRYGSAGAEPLGNRFHPQCRKPLHTKCPPLRGATGGKHLNKLPKFFISRHYFVPLTLNSSRPPKKHRKPHSTIQLFNYSTLPGH